ncbi:hypothetical protein HYX02_05320 [Candidatus Woesearchaeota archaeon]|nr:hypothetical protein [Candidatus Woesearchaeota archaeon]
MPEQISFQQWLASAKKAKGVIPLEELVASLTKLQQAKDASFVYLVSEILNREGMLPSLLEKCGQLQIYNVNPNDTYKKLKVNNFQLHTYLADLEKDVRVGQNVLVISWLNLLPEDYGAFVAGVINFPDTKQIQYKHVLIMPLKLIYQLETSPLMRDKGGVSNFYDRTFGNGPNFVFVPM